MQFWYKKITWQAQLLRPVSWLYRLVIALRFAAYRLHIFRSSKLKAVVVIIGNLTVGGTGKTPLAIAIARRARSHNINLGIITRGYAGSNKSQPILIDATSNAKQVGDEALLLAKYSGCPVVVCRNRVAAANYLIEKLNCDLIISDDGLQHYALQRDIEINVIDQTRHYGNNLCLPAGPLREPISRGDRTNFTVYNCFDTQLNKTPKDSFCMQMRSGLIYNLLEPEIHLNPMQTDMEVHAVAGIGNPQRFFTQLRRMGFIVIEHAFADHYFFKAKDFDFADELPIIITEKDAVKCAKIATDKVWCLPIEAELSADFWHSLEAKLTKLTKLIAIK